ncbi:MAG: hypothetical protein Q9184_000449 [Pyrenodesmia sp. 2 TL-2023]
MPSSEALTDDYLAQLLAKDAKDRTIKYSSYGLQSLLPKRPTTNAPKPNTRFLKNIIKETDNHNAALRAKDIADAKARLRGINNATTTFHDRGWDDGRHMDSEGHARKRRSIGREDDYGRLERPKEPAGRSHTHADNKRQEKRRSIHREDNTAESEVERSRHRRHRKRRHSRSTSPSSERARRPRKDRRPHRSRSRSHRQDHRSHRHRQRRFPLSPPSPVSPPSGRSPKPPTIRKRPSRPASSHPSSDSDPLASIIGPLRPSTSTSALLTQPRGRGSTQAYSDIDLHFAPSYDPTHDIRPASPTADDDWDNALEALRDRARWKKAGGERLRAAGFTDEEVAKWEKGGEDRVEDVKWKGPGEGREWDRGKVVKEDGAVGVEPVEWGRLKGT